MIHLFLSVVFIGVSLVNALREKWDAACFFLLAAGLITVIFEIRKNGSINYTSCQWFMSPPPSPDTPEDVKSDKKE